MNNMLRCDTQLQLAWNLAALMAAVRHTNPDALGHDGRLRLQEPPAEREPRMTEKDFWSRYVQPKLHEPTCGRVAWKVQDAFRKGLPDVDVCVEGCAHKLELKYVKKYPARESTTVKVGLTHEQRRYLSEWSQAGGSSLVLLGIERDWYLLRYDDLQNRAGFHVGELYELALHWGDLSNLDVLVSALKHA